MNLRHQRNPSAYFSQCSVYQLVNVVLLSGDIYSLEMSYSLEMNCQCLPYSGYEPVCNFVSLSQSIPLHEL